MNWLTGVCSDLICKDNKSCREATIDLKEYTLIQPGACQHKKFLGNRCFLPKQLIDLKEFFKAVLTFININHRNERNILSNL